MNNTKNNHIKHWETRGRKGTKLKNGYRHGQVFLKRKYEHRRIMETFMGRELTKDEVIHHINHNREDNRIINLKVMKRSDHARMHAFERKLGTNRKGVSPSNKLSVLIINKIKYLRGKGKLLREIATELKLSYPTVQKYGKQ